MKNKKITKIIKNVFYPNKIFGFIIFNIGTFLLIYVFIMHLEDKSIAYVSYLLSFYALVIFVLWFIKLCKFTNGYIKENSNVYKIHNDNHSKITELTLFLSLIINFTYGTFKLFLGIYYSSAWFITFAIYYLLLCFMRFMLFLSIKDEEISLSLKRQYKEVKHIGIILLFLDIILLGMIILIINQNQIIKYPGYLIYVVALYDFYLIINAFVKVFKYKKQNSPILLVSKCINLTVAMISIISLEVAMLTRFGNGDNNLKLIMISWTGFVFVIINSLMSFYMIIKESRLLKNDKTI